MQFIHDHIIASLIAATAILIISATQLHTTEIGVGQVSAHAAKTKALTFGAWLEDDILSLGANFGQNRSRFRMPVYDTGTYADTANTLEWVFYSDEVLNSGTTNRIFTRYQLLPTDTLVVQGTARPLFQARREVAVKPVVNDVAVPPTEAEWAEDGRSVGTLSFFQIGLLRRDGEITADSTKADYIRERFSLVPEFELQRAETSSQAQYLHELYWTTTLKVRPFWEPPPVTPPGAPGS